MSEPIPAEILIGGRMAGKLVPELCDAISVDNLAPEWGEGPFLPGTAADLLANRSEHHGAKVLRLYDAEARYGRFEQLEGFLEEHGIAYDRFSDGKYEYEPEWVAFRPGDETVVIAIDINHEPIVQARVLSAAVEQVTRAIKRLRRGETPQVLAVLQALQESLTSEMPKLPAPLPSLEIDAEPFPA